MPIQEIKTTVPEADGSRKSGTTRASASWQLVSHCRLSLRARNAALCRSLQRASHFCLRTVGRRLRSASGGRKSPDFCSVHAVNQGIDIPRSPKKFINSDRSHNISRRAGFGGRLRQEYVINDDSTDDNSNRRPQQFQSSSEDKQPSEQRDQAW